MASVAPPTHTRGLQNSIADDLCQAPEIGLEAVSLPACSCICASGWAGMWSEAITYLAKGI